MERDGKSNTKIHSYSIEIKWLIVFQGLRFVGLDPDNEKLVELRSKLSPDDDGCVVYGGKKQTLNYLNRNGDNSIGNLPQGFSKVTLITFVNVFFLFCLCKGNKISLCRHWY